MTLWLKILGSVILFLSWLCQNHFQRDWQDKREDLDRLRVRIVANDILANVWYAAFVDQEARPQIDLVPTATIGLQYINFSHQVRLAAARWHNGSVDSMLAESKSYLDDALAAPTTGQLSRILDLTDKARKLDESAAISLVSDNEAKYADIRAQEQWWGAAFEVLYLCGAALISISFVVSLPTRRRQPDSSA